MKSKVRLRRRLFRQYAATLSLFIPHLAGQFACPLCFALFTEDAIYDDRVTLAHVLPKVIGEQTVTLLCKRCNAALSKNENHLKWYANAFWGLPVGKSETVGLEFDGIRIAASVQTRRNAESGRIERNLEVNPKGNRAEDVFRAAMHFETTLREWRNQGIEGRLPVDRVNWRYDILRVNAAMLSAAYLEAFRVLGYAYVLNSNLDPIRREMLNPVGLGKRATRVLPLTGAANGALYIVSEPVEARSLLFVYRDEVVVLPAAADRELEIYDPLWGYGTTLRKSRLPFDEVFRIDGFKPGSLRLNSGGIPSTVYSYPDAATLRRVDESMSSANPWLVEGPTWSNN